MAITATMNDKHGGDPSTPTYFVDMTITPDTSYPTGGWTGFAATVVAAAKAATPALNIGSLVKANVFGILPLDTAGYTVAYDKAGDKLKVYYSNSDSADGPLVELPDTTDIHTTTLRFTVVCC